MDRPRRTAVPLLAAAAICTLLSLLLCCCSIGIAPSPLLVAASRAAHPILSASDVRTAPHASRHIRTLQVVNSFHVTHADGTPLQGFHPAAPAVPKPNTLAKNKAKRVNTMSVQRDAATDSQQQQQAGAHSAQTQAAEVPEEQNEGNADSEYTDADLSHWSVAGPPHSYHKGMAQLYPDSITLHFSAFGESHAVPMHVMRELFDPDAEVQVFDAENRVIERRKHVLQSYWTTLPDHSAWATATLHQNGQFQAVIFRDGDTIQLDPAQLHEQEMDKSAYRKMARMARNRAGGNGAGGGMVAFKHSDMIDIHKTHRCASASPDGNGGGAGGNGTMHAHDEPLLPYTTAARRRLLQTASATTQGYGNFPTSNSGIIGWTNCFAGDTTQAQKISVGMAVDTGMYQVWGSVVGVTQYIAWQMAVTNLVYLAQLHVFLAVTDVLVQTALGSATPSWNDAPPSAGAKCPITIQTKLNTLSAWRGASMPTRNALWSLQTNCYPPAGTVGIAWIGVLCNTYYGVSISTFSSNQWLTTAHELGHNFNAAHTFQLGQGATGGIMDYGDGRLNGIFQFHTEYSKTSMCSAVSGTAYAKAMQPYCMAPYTAACGNGVVEPGEACDDTSACCNQPGTANPCQLAAAAQCSGESPCCSSCKFKPTTTLCMGGQGICQNGFCAASACAGYSSFLFCGLVPTNPCRQQCSLNGGACSSGYTSPNLNIGDGIVCSTAPYSTCQGGQCVASGSPAAPAVTWSWTTSAWSTCSCQGSRTRTTYCSGSDGSTGTAGVQCPLSTRPSQTETCSAPASCTTYSWLRSSWSACSVNCGSGVQQATVQCISSATNTAVAESSCPSASKPASTASCNTQACPVVWTYSDWTACSVNCGGGTSTRSASCTKTQNGVVSTVTDASCGSLTKEATSRACNTPACVTVPDQVTYSLWYGSWGACSASCSGGTQTRPAYCVGTDGRMTDLSRCNCGPGTTTLVCPSTTQACNTKACPTYAWNNPEWGSCSLSCGGGLQTRNVQCIDEATNVAVANSYCTAAQPSGVRSCNTQLCESAKWVTGAWRPCDVECGGGTQSRTVVCVDSSGSELPDSACAGTTKPASSNTCNGQACPSYEWRLSGWSSCSSWCGGGIQTRSVKCVKKGTMRAVSYTNCDTTNIPATAQYCNTDIQCPLDSDVQWKLADWSSCSSICGGDAIRNRTVLCTNTTTGLEIDPKFCPQDFRPETSSLCPEVTCPTYWHAEPWTACTASCAGGVQTRTVECRYRDDGDAKAIDDDQCTGAKPSGLADCNLFPCPAWAAEPWGECDKRCGDGLRTRAVSCITWDKQNTSAEACAAAPIPPVTEACSNAPCPHWHRGPWSYCDRPCGGGNQSRPLACHMPHDDVWHGQLVADESLCPAVDESDAGDGVGDAEHSGGRPALWQLCNTEPCSTTYWDVIKWTECDAKECGGGTQTGLVVCKSSAAGAAGENEEGIVSNDQCFGASPPASRPCNTDPCPVYEWKATKDWSGCSAVCGAGTQTREVSCVNVAPAAWLSVPYEIVSDESRCGGLGTPKPPTLQSCFSPTSVCWGTGGDETKRPNGLCTSEGTCLCRAGFAGQFCDQTPRISSVLTNAATFSNGVPWGDVLQISWVSEGSLPYVSILLTRSAAKEPSENWPVPSYIARDIVNTGRHSWPLGSNLPDLEDGDGFVVVVWFSPSIQAASETSFTIADPCDYKNCGVHGECGVGGVCTCVAGYSGATCALGPCERTRCSTSYGSCLNELYIGAPNVTAETVGVCYCGENERGEHWDGFQCRTPPGCTPRCKNGADLINVIIDLEGRTSEEAGQCGVCACTNMWGGDDCDVCGLQCFNGGTVNEQCTACDCSAAPGFFGTTCSCKFYSLTLRLTLPANLAASTFLDDPLVKARFARTLAIDLALAAGQVAGVNVQVDVVDILADTQDPAQGLLAQVRFGLECPQLSAEIVGGGSVMDTATAQAIRGIATSAQSKDAEAFNNRLSPATVRDDSSASYFPNRAAHEAFRSVLAARMRSAFGGVGGYQTADEAAGALVAADIHPSVDIQDGRATLLSVYGVVASSLEDLSGPFYRGVVTSTLSRAAVVSATDLSGVDHPRVPGAATDPFLAAQISGGGDGTVTQGGGSGGLSTGALIGIIVGSIVGALCLVGLGVCAWRSRKDHVQFSAAASLAGHAAVELPPSSNATPAVSRPRTPPQDRRSISMDEATAVSAGLSLVPVPAFAPGLSMVPEADSGALSPSPSPEAGPARSPSAAALPEPSYASSVGYVAGGGRGPSGSPRPPSKSPEIHYSPPTDQEENRV